ncbi:MAG TPA: hypothetical protein VGD98_03160 [Ktedonobacteraceae bacterium]
MKIVIYRSAKEDEQSRATSEGEEAARTVQGSSEQERHNASASIAPASFTRYLQGFYEQGLVRTDLPLPALISLFSSICLGFFLAAPLLPDTCKLSDEQLAEMMAETGQHALERGESASPAALHAADSLNSFLDQGMARGQTDNVSG